MAQHFDARNAPFDRLTRRRGRIWCATRSTSPISGRTKRSSAAGARPTACSSSSRALVEERDGDDLVALRGPGDAFDSRAIVQGGGVQRFRRARGNALQPAAARRHPPAHRPESALRLVLLSRHRPQARRGLARGGGGALRPAAGRAGRATCSSIRPCSSTRRIRSPTPARGCMQSVAMRCSCAVTRRRHCHAHPTCSNATILDRRAVESPIGPLAHQSDRLRRARRSHLDRPAPR